MCHSLPGAPSTSRQPTATRTLTLWLGVLLLPTLAAAAGRLAADATSTPTRWTITYDGKPVFVYEADPQKYKPYVKALNTLEGTPVLRDAPADHLHHHALMYGIKVNGINFWEEIGGSGVQKPVESTPPELGQSPAGLPQARLVQVLYWLAPQDAFLPNTNAPALLVERRTLTLTIAPQQRETALHWKSQFEVGTRTNEVVLTGSNYHGLGMRFLQELDPFAVHFTPQGKPDLADNRQVVASLPWEALSFARPDKPLAIALFGAPANARGDARYFSMRTPFAYLSATQALDQEPLVYHKGDRFELNYLVVVYPELKSTEALALRGRQWITSLR